MRSEQVDGDFVSGAVVLGLCLRVQNDLGKTKRQTRLEFLKGVDVCLLLFFGLFDFTQAVKFRRRGWYQIASEKFCCAGGPLPIVIVSFHARQVDLDLPLSALGVLR